MGRADGEAAEPPPRRVAIARPFSIAQLRSAAEFVAGRDGSNPSRWKGARNSVELSVVRRGDEFCGKATQLMRADNLIGPRQLVRLPTEAEWEYCARAGTATRYSFGDDAARLDEFAWCTHNAAGNDPPVGAKRPNAWNLYDMHGYLWEWCADAWHDDYDQAPTDGSAWTAGGDTTRRVLRGGSWKDPAERLTSSSRRGAPRDQKDDAVGLRCVLAEEQ